LQRRLGGAGFPASGAQPGTFCSATAVALRAFQHHRGLHEQDFCDEATWLALVEASWRLGDRPLKLVAPNLRGDDVAALQTQLAKLGFDCGRVDGIFGNRTATALEDFQRNCGLEVDGICGPITSRALDAISSRTGSGPGVAVIREIEQLGNVAASLHDLRVVVGQFGGLSSLTRSVAQELRALGAKVIAVDEPDPTFQAAAANRHAANVYAGFEAHADARATVSYYSTEGFESAGGRSLATQLAAGLERTGVLVDVRLAGMRLPVLRETRMTAVVCSLGPVKLVTDAAGALADTIVAALAAWAESPTRLAAAET
jgi:N-acetylmuramoyl-L-alanine amidase